MKKKFPLFAVIVICILFFAAYTMLSVVRHLHYGSYGYDLGINDQVVWRYAHFQLPLTTIDPSPDKTKFAEHVELVYALVAPFYWLWSSPLTLIIVRNAWFCLSGLAVFLIAKKHKLHPFICVALVLSYLGFYGVQNALWTDVHSNSFANAFLLWFVYFLETKKQNFLFSFSFSPLQRKKILPLGHCF